MQRLLTDLFGGRLKRVLVLSFSMIAAITVGIEAMATSRTITDYLARAADERVARDMDLALAFYRIRMERIARVSQRLALSQALRQAVPAAVEGDTQAKASICEEVTENGTARYR